VRRSPIQRKASIKKSSKSSKKAAFDREFAKVRPDIIDRDVSCRAVGLVALEDGACGMGWHVHHIHRRSQGGSNDPSNLVLLCGIHHDHVHGNPAWSKENGLMR
jgi:5-methylcytosine-specific restriction endonuclease McrA